MLYFPLSNIDIDNLWYLKSGCLVLEGSAKVLEFYFQECLGTVLLCYHMSAILRSVESNRTDLKFRVFIEVPSAT